MGGGTQWLGTHPLVADVIMMGLTSETARKIIAHPVTDRTDAHLAIAGFRAIDVATAPLPELKTANPSGGDEALDRRMLELRVAQVAFRYVRPEAAGELSVPEILELRRRTDESREAFRKRVQDMLAELSATPDADPVWLERRIEGIARDLKKILTGFNPTSGTLDSRPDLEWSAPLLPCRVRSERF